MDWHLDCLVSSFWDYAMASKPLFVTTSYVSTCGEHTCFPGMLCVFSMMQDLACSSNVLGGAITSSTDCCWITSRTCTDRDQLQHNPHYLIPSPLLRLPLRCEKWKRPQHKHDSCITLIQERTHNERPPPEHEACLRALSSFFCQIYL